MSKVDKPVKQSTSSQLKKELNQASKVIQNLANSLERLESNLSDAETSLIRERLLKEELSSTKEEIKALQEAQYKVQKERQEEIALFADVNLKLTGEFQERLTKSQLQYESRLKDCQRREELVEAKWKHNVDFEKAETSRLRELESRDRQEIKSQLQKAKEVWQKKEEQFNTNLRQRERQIAELSDKNKALIQELSEHETMLKGRDTEMQRLGGRLSALEAFPPQDVTDKLPGVIADLEKSLREFCVWCVESADTLPAWNRFPDGVRNDPLPRSYSSESASGRFVLIAAIQSSICTAMEQNFLPPLGPYANRGFWDVSEALFRNNQSHEAIWRLMTANTILGDQQMLDDYKANLREVAKSLLSSWKPFPGDSQMEETLNRLTRLLIDSATVSLELQKVRKRIRVSVDVVSQFFDSDSEEDAYNVPGGFDLPDSTTAVLCLFPAFFWAASPAATSQPTLLRKGKAMFRDSPPLLLALRDEQAMRSPNMSSKRRPTT